MKHHVLVTGTGRTGTTAFMRILSYAGEDTGFKGDEPDDPISHGGLEKELPGYSKDETLSDAPRWCKGPAFSDCLRDIVQDESLRIDGLVIPMRSLNQAAASRIEATRKGAKAGGMWRASNRSSQKRVLRTQVYDLLLAAASANYYIPVVLLEYPTFLRDPARTYRKISHLMKVTYERFEEAAGVVVQESLIHDY